MFSSCCTAQNCNLRQRTSGDVSRHKANPWKKQRRNPACSAALVALIVTPWAAVRILKPSHAGEHGEREDRLTRLYRRVMGAILHRTPLRWGFLAGVVFLLLGSCSLFYFQFLHHALSECV